MALNPPPNPKFQVLNGIMFVQTWYLWFLELYNCFIELETDDAPASATGSDGLVDGGRRLTGSSCFMGGRRV